MNEAQHNQFEIETLKCESLFIYLHSYKYVIYAHLVRPFIQLLHMHDGLLLSCNAFHG
jgi:hypothetical protein